MTRIAVIGLGKLGSPLAAVLASSGFDVVGIDVSDTTVDLVNAGRAPVEEPGLQELISEHRARLRATTDFGAVADTDLSIVLVPTPSDETGAFSNDHVLAAIERLGAALAGRADYHVLVVGSTVMPGSCQDEVLRALEASSRRRVGQTLGLCYSPEFIALGSVIRDLVEPDMVLIGESDRRAGDALERVYRMVCRNDPPFRRMQLVNAELTKIAVNTYITMKISYANTVAAICERLAGADAETVTAAVGLDSRIGPKYLRGATAYGGPCFPRDTKAFATMMRELGLEPLLAEATDAVNRARIDELARLTQSHLGSGEAVGILGLSYKPWTSVTDESAGMELARVLSEAGHEVHGYDPAVRDLALNGLGERITGCASIAELYDLADVVVVTTPWPEFAEVPDEAIASRRRRVVVIDCWGLVSSERYGAAVDIVRLGRQSSRSGLGVS